MVAALIAGFCFAPITQDPVAGKIVFVSERDGNNEIYSMSADGTNVKRLTNNVGVDVEPCWSPDGKFVAWASNRTKTWHIWVMNSDGTNQHQLTTTPDHVDRNPMWSVSTPKYIAYVSNNRFYTIRIDAARDQLLMPKPMAADSQPAMSPITWRFVFLDGFGHILLQEGRDFFQKPAIAYGKNGNPAQIFHPSWSSDAAQIVVDSGGATPKLYTIDMQDLALDTVPMEGYGYDPVFSKQDTAVVFTSSVGQGKGTDIYTVDLDAASRMHGQPKPTNLSNSPGNDSQACYWEPKVED